MAEQTAQIFIQLLVTIGAVVAAWLGFRAQIRAQEKDRASLIDDRIKYYIAQMEDDINEARARIKTLELENQMWKEGALMLFRQVVRADLTPAWRPPDNGPSAKGST